MDRPMIGALVKPQVENETFPGRMLSHNVGMLHIISYAWQAASRSQMFARGWGWRVILCSDSVTELHTILYKASHLNDTFPGCSAN
jgi:hypothetical protein